MKEKNRQKKRKHRFGAGAIFTLTLCIVLSIGMAGILSMVFFKGEETGEQGKTVKEDD